MVVLLLLSVEVVNAASSVDLTVSGTINEGTCTLSLNDSPIMLEAIDSSNTKLNEKVATKAKSFILNISQCSPGSAVHKPALKFSGSTVNNQLWRNIDFNDDNNAGKAYGIVLNETTNLLRCNNINEDAILPGYCELGDEGDLLTDQNISFDVGYGKSSSPDINTGKVKSSINIAFEYH
ncbi:type 1 fimbrial protein [Escherichia coli]|nr:fimbrial protein [Escherichia coli]EKI4284125.1 type 1 fimbrial protein [Escherichia coli]HDR9919933.1 type 1 fimbrial protein [Escherichia coli RDEC-1 (10f)]